MSLDALLDAIRRDADERRDEILARARSEADRIVAEARAEAEERRKRRRTRAETEARAEAAARLAEVRREGRERILAARAGVMDRIFRRAREEVASGVESEAYGEALPRILAGALGHVGASEVVVLCSPGLGAVVEETLNRIEEDSGAPSETLSWTGSVRVLEEPDVAPGFRVEGGEDDPVVDGSLEAALRRLRPRISIELVDRVEKGGEPEATEAMEGPAQEEPVEPSKRSSR